MEKSVTNPFLLQDQTVHPAQIDLPEELRKKVVILQCESEEGICKVYLVGTRHCSSQSCEDVEAIIGFLKPDVVFLELCETRAYFCLKSGDHQLTVVPRFIDAKVATWRRNNSNAFATLLNLIMKKYRKQLGVGPVCEFQSAYREAKKYGGKVILGDRPIEITDQRTWSKMTFWYKTKFVFIFVLLLAALSLVSVREDANNENTESIEWHFPSMAETLLHERDLYMASRLFEVAKECKSVVEVVGKGHVAGIQKNWKKPIIIESLMEVEAATSPSAVKLWILVALAALGIALFSVIWLK
ncbi:hypothetical protein SUGI_0343730 [Cryptomeria japonica]|uniref:uncharacterized protein LOC131079224 n=1 Tax=Cryptomeria japonica TaxID=3369 RepID=UPI002408BA95|nr:uncharacterized protein LOC131079224 [Cryptomeria japonica]GLJ19142.1 hypothetical protein SUGI_0343730 [Cryptomeria japonica]